MYGASLRYSWSVKVRGLTGGENFKLEDGFLQYGDNHISRNVTKPGNGTSELFNYLAATISVSIF